MTLRTIIYRAAALMPAAFVCLVALKAPVAAESTVKQRGETTFEASWYPRSAAFGGQKNSFFHVEVQPELSVFDDTTEWVLKPRISGGTAGVGVVDFREAHITSRIGEMDVLVGNTILFWGKVESYNPVDVVNSLDYGRGLMRSEKLGAPMAQVSLPIGSGQLDLLAIDFVKNIYPGRALRERVEPSVQIADDLRALVADDLAEGLVPEDGDGEPRARGGADLVVQIADEIDVVVVRIRPALVVGDERADARGVREDLAGPRERPPGVRVARVVRPGLLPRRVDGGDGDDVLLLQKRGQRAYEHPRMAESGRF